jgi:hypothetical protein
MVWRTSSVPAARSVAAQAAPTASPRRMPVTAMVANRACQSASSWRTYARNVATSSGVQGRASPKLSFDTGTVQVPRPSRVSWARRYAAVMTAGRLSPLTLDERRARGYCTCPQSVGSSDDAADGRCSLHPDGRDLPEDERTARGLHFYDDRRDRNVTWPDAVEAMRQARYAGASNPELAMFTWMNLMRLLAVLRDPSSAPEGPEDESEADELIGWAGDHVPVGLLRWLLVFARGGGAGPMCDLLRWQALNNAT